MTKKSILILFVIFILASATIACSSTFGSPIDTEQGYIKLLYPDAGVEYWLVEEKKLPVDIRAVVEELIKDEKNGIPKDTKILDIKIEDRIAYINLSKEFEKLSLGDNVIWRNIYIIVNTLTLNENLNIDSVQFLLEGKVEQFFGDTITDKPKSNNVELMKMY